MNNPRTKTYLIALPLIAGLLLLTMPALALINLGQSPSVASAQQACSSITDPASIPAPNLINFDDLPDAVVIADHYRSTFGVAFEDGQLTRAITYGLEPDKAHSIPNVAVNDAIPPGNSAGVPMRINFDEPKTDVGFYVGNGGGAQIAALMTAYDASGAIICQMRLPNVPDAHTAFMGLNDSDGRIVSVTLDYGQTTLSESIDDLYFAPRRGIPPTRTPMPTWTPVPTSTPLPGPSPTPTPVVPMFAYKHYVMPIAPIVFNADLSIQGIEITQGIQCFDTSAGLATCADNSMPVVNKKDTSARVYLKFSSLFGGSQSNVPVRLFIRAAGVWYQVDATGKATGSIDQTKTDSANIWFNVNFLGAVTVDFYAVVDPNDIIAETDETNNRYPASGYITLTFQPRRDMTIVGQRLRYHPAGYSGEQYAGGWAVNGGGADWYNQVLPLRNNAINYTVKSGYLDWTTSLGSGDGQHSLIKYLNFQWIMENALAWWFGSGTFTGANHVYGWAPSAGYSGGHADMPVYPHAGGLGVVAIGGDQPGTSTDNPGSGALVFGHELTHDYNVFHTNTADACGAADPNSDFPYSSSSIQEVGFNPITGKIYNPSLTQDLMSYCPSSGSKLGWIAPFTWNKMFNKLFPYSKQAETNNQPYVFHATAAAESLVINATVYNPDLNPEIPGALGQLYRTEGGEAFSLPAGDYAIELRNVNGALLASYPFIVDFQNEYGDPLTQAGLPSGTEGVPAIPPDPTSKVDVSFIEPWIDGTFSVSLVHLGTVLDQRFVSSNPPQVLITNPTGAETWKQGETHTVSWQGLDLDGNPLVYNLLYSNNGGTDWILLQGDMTTTSATVDVNSMAGGSDVRFRVVATDGINTALDETDQAITIPNQPPVPLIFGPANGSYTPPEGLVVLQGSAMDMEDGSLTDGSLVWSSDRQGELGIGTSLPLNTLESGTHIITLTATDSYGISTRTSVLIYIAYPIYTPLVQR